MSQAQPGAQVDPAAPAPVEARTVEAGTVALSTDPEDELVKFYVPGGVVHQALPGLILPADQAAFAAGGVDDVHAAKVRTRTVAGCVDGGAAGGVAGVGFGGVGLGTLQALATEISEPAEWVVRDPVSGRLDKGLHCTPSGARPSRQLDPGSGQPTGFWVLPPADCTAKTAAVSIPGRTLPASGLRPPDFAPVDAGWRVGGVPADYLAPFPGAQLVVPAGGGALPPVLGWETERVARAVVGGLPGAAADVGLSLPARAPDLTAGFLGAELQSLIWEDAQNPVLTWRHPSSGALTQCRYERDVLPSGRPVTYRWCTTDVEPVRLELPGVVDTAFGWGFDKLTEGMVGLFTSTLAGP